MSNQELIEGLRLHSTALEHTNRKATARIVAQAADALERYESPSTAQQAAPAERGVDDIRSAAARAYGFLWHVNNEPGTPSPMYSADKAAYRARVALRDQLTNEERGKAIVAVGIELGRYDPATADSDVREVK